MSSYDSEAAEIERLTNEYNRLVRIHNREAERHNMLVVETAECEHNVASTIDIIDALHDVILPPLSTTAKDTEKEEVVAENVSRTIDDLVSSYRLLKNDSTATKNLTGYHQKYATYFGPYNELRKVSLGYIVGLDANIWQSDAPRQTVEKMYLANTDYWLAYATMAVMLWASDEKEACERAVSKSMQINERRSALFFLLASIRFNRFDAAKKWYQVYFDLVDSGGMGEEIVCILQVLLCGALGADIEFAKMVQARMRTLLQQTRANVYARNEAQSVVDGYFFGYMSKTNKEYLALKHICPEYQEMINLLSDAEKNAKLRDAFAEVINSDSPLSDRLSERIEDALYALISSYDPAEEDLLNRIAYEETVVKAKGNLQEAQVAFNKIMEAKRQNHNLSVIMANTALSRESSADMRVKKFALDFVRPECEESARRFSMYRQRERAVYDFEIDGCKMRGDENSLEQNKGVLNNHYDNMIKTKIKADESAGKMKAAAIVMCIFAVIFTILAVVGIAASWDTSAFVTFLVIAIILWGIFALCIFLRYERGKKIRTSFEYRINNGMKMLTDGLAQLREWRTAYHEADNVHAELIKILKEVN